MAVSRPTVYDVAARAGVSIATVSFAFRRPEKVREETRATVLKAAAEIGYVPSGSARNLARGRTGVLGLHLFDLLLDSTDAPEPGSGAVSFDEKDLAGPILHWDADEDARLNDPQAFPLYVDEVQRGFVLECRRAHTAVLLRRSGVTPADLAETAGQVDGLAILPDRTGQIPADTVSSSVPVVSVSSAVAAGHHVLADNAGGIRMLVDHLVDVHEVRTLGWVGTSVGWDPGERLEAFREATADREGVDAAEVIDDTEASTEAELAVVRARARAGTLPAALICATDQTALTVMAILRSEGVSVPDDVKVVGFDGIQAARTSRPSLTTVRQPMELMGRLAAHLLLTDDGRGAEGHRTITVAVALQRGESCGCEPGAPGDGV